MLSVTITCGEPKRFIDFIKYFNAALRCGFAIPPLRDLGFQHLAYVINGPKRFQQNLMVS